MMANIIIVNLEKILFFECYYLTINITHFIRINNISIVEVCQTNIYILIIH